MREINALLLGRLREVLLRNEPLCTADAFREMTELGLSPEEAMAAFLMGAMGLDAESSMGREIYRGYLPRMLRGLETAFVREDPYVRAMGETAGERNGRVLCMDAIAPFTLFVRDDMCRDREGRILPALGFMPEEVRFPALYGEGLSWMSAEPNEIATLRPLAEAAKGRVAVMGLGIGYVLYHLLLNPSVSEIVCVERDRDILELFTDVLLPRFPENKKMTLIEADAFDWVRCSLSEFKPDTVLVDLWRDAGDGIPLYRRMKTLETPGIKWQYWIEKTMQIYLEEESGYAGA